MMAMRWGAVGLVLLGLMLNGAVLYSMSTQLDLVEVGLETTITDTYAGRNPWGMFTDREGERHSCKGSFEVGETIVYDPASPGRCRPEWAVGGFSSGERTWLSIGGVLVLLGIVVYAFEFFLTRDSELDKAMRGELGMAPPDPDRLVETVSSREPEERW